MEFKNIQDLTDEIQKLKSAQRLLEELWTEVGPYNVEVPKKIAYKMQNYFGYDDSH